MAKEQADRIRELSKEWLETGDDRILDEIDHMTHDAARVNVFNRRIAERYVESTLELHVHFIQIGFGFEDMSKHKCAVAKRLVSPLNCTVSTTRNVARGETGINELDSGQGKRPVLIDVHQLVQSPEGMIEPILIPTIIRLQSLDDCLSLNGHTAESIPSKLPVEPVHGTANRELIVECRSSLVDDDQLVDDVVKRRSEIVQTIPDDATETEIGIGERCREVVEAIPIEIFLDNHGAVILMPRNLGFYRGEVYFSPDDFFPNSVKRMIHEAA